MSASDVLAIGAHVRLRLGSDEEYAKIYREILTEAVRCRLRSAFPVGSMLSRRLGIPLVTCIAQ